ncbi:uncharacterized protein K452DRAFT_110451 [Aplosporella prunicola CBS 121167]|uniref:Uncharacterized protein n=1 Tax=Aplosporella prunicola CBS 121167 TaxID=1176127 RepID=A0A6A6B2E3_9PEZI|nr:uncharacterized protein K452DRAFT_110451 [Aplosporella prunicola CBS 121167]KAF2137384.1 hypothetical protein K452DRAFT_110451 [Aplosporella prunicola CBS 121167]
MQNENKQSDTQPDDELSTVRAQNAVLQEQIVELNKRLAQADAEHAEELSFLKQEHAARGQKNQDLNLRYQQTKDEKLKRIGNTITLAKRVAELETEVYVLRKELEFALLSENDGESDCECEDCDSEMTDIDESASEASFVLEKGEAEQSNYSTSLFRSKGSLSPASIVFVG